MLAAASWQLNLYHSGTESPADPTNSLSSPSNGFARSVDDSAASFPCGKVPSSSELLPENSGTTEQAEGNPDTSIPDALKSQAASPSSIATPSINQSANRGEIRRSGAMEDESAGNPPAQAASPPGLRLAPDVRLPAAALPVDFEMTPLAEQALKVIIDDYYRDLAAGLAPHLDAAGNGKQPVDNMDGPVIETGENGEKTVVVPNGAVSEYARNRADARFRALFGNAAFNRMTIQSALESRLPAEPSY
jgi:hypothetical protein